MAPTSLKNTVYKYIKIIIVIVFKILAVFGVLTIIGIVGGRNFSAPSSAHSHGYYAIYGLLFGIALILPLFFYYRHTNLFKETNKEDNLKTYLPLYTNHISSFEKEKTKEIIQVYIYNGIDKIIKTKDIVIKPREFYVFQVLHNEVIEFNIGIKLCLDENKYLVVEDKKSQLKGIGEDYLEDYNIPNNVDFAFSIDYPYLGDLNYEIEDMV